MVSVSEEKKQLRQQIRERKLTMDRDETDRRSAEIFAKVEQTALFQEAKVVIVYWSLPDEVKTHDFILKWHDKKMILLPVISENRIIVKQFTGIRYLQNNERYGIPEPVGELFQDLTKIDLIIVPGMAFDTEGNRLGRGKAFYDIFLRNSNAFKIGVCFSFQMLPGIPVEEMDIPMDEVISA